MLTENRGNIGLDLYLLGNSLFGETFSSSIGAVVPCKAVDDGLTLKFAVYLCHESALEARPPPSVLARDTRNWEFRLLT